MMQSVDVCIVGAGPGGALLSYLLAKKGLSVLLVERTNTIAKAFRGEHVNVEGEEILKRYDLFSEIEQLGLLRMEQVEYWQDGSCFKTIEADPQIGHLGIHVPQAHLLQVIIKRASVFPNFQFCLQTTLDDLVEDENGRYVGVMLKQNGEQQFIKTKFIVGADGRYSTVRKKAKIDVDVHKHGYDLLWARIPQPDNWPPSIKMTYVDGQQISIFTQSLGYIQIGWNIEQKSYPRLRKQSFEPFIEKLIVAFPQLQDVVQANIHSWDDFVLLDVFSSTSKTWGKNEVLLMGDAVHTMTPTGAYGLNSAMKDAEVLASILTKQQIEQIDLLTCAAQRQQEVAKIQALQREKEENFSSNFALLG